MPVRIDDKKRTTVAGDHLIPSPAGSPTNGFVSAKTGKTHSRGVVVYLGRDLTPEMMLERYSQVSRSQFDSSKALLRLAAYCEALQLVKVGNVVSLAYSPDGLPLLSIEQDHFLGCRKVNLP